MTTLEEFYDDESCLLANKKIPLLAMLCEDSIEGFDVSTTEPYSKLVEQKIWRVQKPFQTFQSTSVNGD